MDRTYEGPGRSRSNHRQGAFVVPAPVLSTRPHNSFAVIDSAGLDFQPVADLGPIPGFLRFRSNPISPNSMRVPAARGVFRLSNSRKSSIWAGRGACRRARRISLISPVRHPDRFGGLYQFKPHLPAQHLSRSLQRGQSHVAIGGIEQPADLTPARSHQSGQPRL